MLNADFDDDRIDPAEKCETDGCGNTAILRLRYPHTRLCAECWEEAEAEEADRQFDMQREARVFGRGA